jgi:hypothetical protein
VRSLQTLFPEFFLKRGACRAVKTGSRNCSNFDANPLDDAALGSTDGIATLAAAPAPAQ